MRLAYSEDRDLFHDLGDFDSHEEAWGDLLQHCDLEEGGTVWIGTAVECDISRYLPTWDDLSEEISVQAYDEVGEAADNWPDAPKEACKQVEKEVQDILLRFLKEHSPAKFFRIESETEYLVGPGMSMIERVPVN
jgi:hypothetical protein